MAFHTKKDVEDKHEREKNQAKELLSIIVLGLANPQQAWKLLHKEPDQTAVAPDPEMEWQITEPYFRVESAGPPPEIVEQFHYHTQGFQ